MHMSIDRLTVAYARGYGWSSNARPLHSPGKATKQFDRASAEILPKRGASPL